MLLTLLFFVFQSRFQSVHRCCWRSWFGGRAGQCCAISAKACFSFFETVSFGGYALQGKGFASAESLTCSTFTQSVFHCHTFGAGIASVCMTLSTFLLVCQNMLYGLRRTQVPLIQSDHTYLRHAKPGFVPLHTAGVVRPFQGSLLRYAGLVF